MSEDMKVVNIPLGEIHADDEFNCRGKITPIDVVTLAKDIEKQGLIQPVVVTLYDEEQQKSTGCKYRLIAGYRRRMAHQVLERSTIPAIVRTDMVDDIDARFFNLAENLQREDLNVLQEAKALQKLKDLGISEIATSERLGKSRGWVQIRYMLLDLPEQIQREVALKNITQTQVREIYSHLKKGGEEAAFAAAKEIKELKARGRTNISVNPDKHKKTSKKQRTRAEIFGMMEHIQTSGIGNGLWTRCLSWAAGEISGIDLFDSLNEYAQRNGIQYIKPSDDE